MAPPAVSRHCALVSTSTLSADIYHILRILPRYGPLTLIDDLLDTRAAVNWAILAVPRGRASRRDKPRLGSVSCPRKQVNNKKLSDTPPLASVARVIVLTTSGSLHTRESAELPQSHRHRSLG